MVCNFSALLEWERVEVQLPVNTNLFVFEAVRGGTSKSDDEGDICVDSIFVYAGLCSECAEK